MTSNPDPNEQAQEVTFSLKTKETSHAPLNFNNNSVKQVQFQKYLVVYLYGKLDFCVYLQNIFRKVEKTIGYLLKLQNNLPRALLVTIHKFLFGHI